MILIVPMMSWALAVITLRFSLNQGWPLPYQLLGYPVMPDLLWKIPGLPPVLSFIVQQPNLYMKLVFTILYIVFLSALMSFLYSFVYRLVGPPRYGPLDLPQPRVKVGRYKR